MALARTLVVLLLLLVAQQQSAAAGTRFESTGFVHVPAPIVRYAGSPAGSPHGRGLRDEVGGAVTGIEGVRITLPTGLVVDAPLEVNRHLFADNYEVLKMGPDGAIVRTPGAAVQRECYYLSKRKTNSSAFVAASSCDGTLRGAVVTRTGDRFEFEHELGSTVARARKLADEYGQFDMDHVVKPDAPTYIDLPEGNFTSKASATSAASTARTAQVGTTLSGEEELFIEVLIVSDVERAESFTSDSELEETNLRIMNQVAAYYANADFDGVFIGISLSGQIILDTDPFGLSTDTNGETDPSDLLTAFNEYRRDNLESFPSHDAFHLLSGTDFTDSTVGLAFLGSMCDDETACDTIENTACYANSGACCFSGSAGCCIRRAGAISQMLTNLELLGAETIAHEMGHQLGFSHDGVDTSADCASSGFIMSAIVDASADLASQTFSTCSVATFVETFETSAESSGYHPYMCLTNSGSNTLSNYTSDGSSDTPSSGSRISRPSPAATLVAVLCLIGMLAVDRAAL